MKTEGTRRRSGRGPLAGAGGCGRESGRRQEPTGRERAGAVRRGGTACRWSAPHRAQSLLRGHISPYPVRDGAGRSPSAWRRDRDGRRGSGASEHVCQVLPEGAAGGSELIFPASVREAPPDLRPPERDRGRQTGHSGPVRAEGQRRAGGRKNRRSTAGAAPAACLPCSAGGISGGKAGREGRPCSGLCRTACVPYARERRAHFEAGGEAVQASAVLGEAALRRGITQRPQEAGAVFRGVPDFALRRGAFRFRGRSSGGGMQREACRSLWRGLSVRSRDNAGGRPGRRVSGMRRRAEG